MADPNLLQGVREKLVLCREYALTGNYSIAVEYYSSILSQINGYLSRVGKSTGGVSRSWREVRKKIKEEHAVVAQLDRDTRPGNWTRDAVAAAAMPPPDPVLPTSSGSAGSKAPVSWNIGGEARVAPTQFSFPEPSSSPILPAQPGRGSSKLHQRRLARQLSKQGQNSGGGVPRGGGASGGNANRRRWAPPVRPRRGGRKRGRGGRRRRGGSQQPQQQPSKAPTAQPEEEGEETEGEGERVEGEVEKYVPSNLTLQPLAEVIEGDVLTSNPNVHWEDIAGLEQAKRLLKEAAILPVWMPEFFTGIREPWRGVLLYGPPGTGKTLLAKAVATECNTKFFNVSLAAITSKWRGESEKLVRILFEMARHYAPSTIFFDEIDALCGQRGQSSEGEASRRVKTEILVQMDGINKNLNDGTDRDPSKLVLVLGATNHPWDLDDAVRRRLEKRIYIPLPDAPARRQIFEMYTKDVVLGEDIDLDVLVEMSEGYSASDIYNVCRDASMMNLRDAMSELLMNRENIEAKQQEIREMPTHLNHFQRALSKVQPSVDPPTLQRFVDWKGTFGAT